MSELPAHVAPSHRSAQTIEIDKFVRVSDVADEVVMSIERWAQRRGWQVRTIGGQRGIAEVGLAATQLTLMYLGERPRRLEPLSLNSLIEIGPWLDRSLIELGRLRSQISQQLEELSKQSQLLANLVSENQRLRQILITHNIDPEAPSRAVSVFQDARGINRRELLQNTIGLLTLFATLLGVAVNVQQRDIARKSEAEVQEERRIETLIRLTEQTCRAAQQSVTEAPDQYFEPDFTG